MKKIVFYGIRYSGRSSTLTALGKAIGVEIIDEYWENEEARIKKIVDSNKDLEIIVCPSPFKEVKARKKLLENAAEIYYFLPFPSDETFGDEELLRQINLFPEMVKKAEALGKSIYNVPWTIVFSKCDRLTHNPYLDKIPEKYLTNYIYVSAKTGTGLEKLWRSIAIE